MPELTVPGGSTIQLEAIDPTTGAQVSGVVVTTLTIFGKDVSADTGQLEDVVPLYSPSDVGSPA